MAGTLGNPIKSDSLLCRENLLLGFSHNEEDGKISRRSSRSLSASPTKIFFVLEIVCVATNIIRFD
jgi:hypothetical protein